MVQVYVLYMYVPCTCTCTMYNVHVRGCACTCTVHVFSGIYCTCMYMYTYNEFPVESISPPPLSVSDSTSMEQTADLQPTSSQKATEGDAPISTTTQEEDIGMWTYIHVYMCVYNTYCMQMNI